MKNNTHNSVLQKIKESYIFTYPIVHFIFFSLGFLLGLFILYVINEKSENLDQHLGSLTDWVTAIGTIITAIFTAILAYVAWNTADSWREQRKPEVISDLFSALEDYESNLHKGYRLVIDKMDQSYALREVKAKKFHKEYMEFLEDSILRIL